MHLTNLAIYRFVDSWLIAFSKFNIDMSLHGSTCLGTQKFANIQIVLIMYRYMELHT